MRTYTPRTRPYAHQIAAGNKAQGRKAFAYFMDMGTGKSKVIIDEIGYEHVAGRVDRVLIATAKGNYGTWHYEQLPKHMPLDIRWVSHLWKSGDSQRERLARDRFLTCYADLRILVVNIEAVAASARAQKYVEAFVRGGKTAVIVDESTLIKNREAQRTIFMTRVGKYAVMRRIATGSPITRDPLDIWGQFQFLGDGLLETRNFFSFRARYCNLVEKHLGKRTILVPESFRNLDELTAIIDQHSFRIMKEECLDLPPKVYEVREVEMTDEQRRLYTSMKEQSLAELNAEGAVVTTNIVMTKITRLHQILCGVIVDDEGEEHEIPSNRCSALMDIAEESGDQSVIVWCGFRASVRDVAAALREKYGHDAVVEFHGGTNTEDRRIAIERFQGKKSRFFVSTQHTGMRGNTLTAATVVVYYSNTTDLEQRQQSEDRAHRIGQTQSVTYIDLMVRDTVDEKLVNALKKKIDLAALVMGDDPRTWLV